MLFLLKENGLIEKKSEYVENCSLEVNEIVKKMNILLKQGIKNELRVISNNFTFDKNANIDKKVACIMCFLYQNGLKKDIFKEICYFLGYCSAVLAIKEM